MRYFPISVLLFYFVVVLYFCVNAVLGASHQLLGYDHKLCTLCNNLDFLVHNYFHLSSSSPKTGEHPSSENMARYRKVLAASLWLQFALVACYLPDGLVFAMVSSSKPTAAVFLAWDYTTTLVFLNSSLNPILYCWKIVGVRQAVKATIRQVLCCS